MTDLRPTWLVARREVRERSRSRTFRASLVLMVVAVVALVLLPGLLDDSADTQQVGITGAAPSMLESTLSAQADAADVDLEVRHFDSVDEGEESLRAEEIDVLVVDAARLEWRDRPDAALQSLVTTAIQVSVVHERAVVAGLEPEAVATLLAPVPVTDESIGAVPGRSEDDTIAALAMSVLLLAAIVVYGNLVLTGVAEEKTSRVVEVLLARVSAKALLAGKVVGIGLLGFAQLAVTALAALVASVAVDSVDLPAVSGGVLAWVVAWFVLGYALYAVVYGALGSLASRSEDAQSLAGPVGYVVIAAYWASFLALDQDPDGVWARVLSLFPATAPLAMPGRVALGATDWWEPWLAALLTLAAIAALVRVAGRVYGNAILHTGATLRLREAWRGRGDSLPQPVRPRG